MKTINKSELNALLEMAIEGFRAAADRRDSRLPITALELVALCAWLERLGISAYQTCGKNKLAMFEKAKNYATIVYSSKTTIKLCEEISREYESLYRVASNT